jgi:hypothetical protein
MSKPTILSDVRPGEQVPPWAEGYDAGDHPAFAYTGDAIVIAPVAGEGVHESELAVAVIRRARKDGPYFGHVAFPGGFVDWGTDPDGQAAALRELDEEAGLADISGATYVETLDTYDANGRDPRQWAGRWDKDGTWVATGARVVSKATLVLVGGARPLVARADEDAVAPQWSAVYSFLPWENQRAREWPALQRRIVDALKRWADGRGPLERKIDWAFGIDQEWNEERSGERIRLLVEAGIIEEGARDRWGQLPPAWESPLGAGAGAAMAFDHRLMLADALSRVRSKIKYLPAALKALAGEEFTLVELHALVQAATGRPIDRGNFWRVIRRSALGLIEPTGRKQDAGRERRTGPVPEIFRFAPDVDEKRLDPSIRFPYTEPDH